MASYPMGLLSFCGSTWPSGLQMRAVKKRSTVVFEITVISVHQLKITCHLLSFLSLLLPLFPCISSSFFHLSLCILPFPFPPYIPAPFLTVIPLIPSHLDPVEKAPRPERQQTRRILCSVAWSMDLERRGFRYVVCAEDGVQGPMLSRQASWQVWET